MRAVVVMLAVAALALPACAPASSRGWEPPAWAPEAVHAKASFALPRKQFGVAYAGKPDDLIRDDVLMTLDVTAPRKAAAAGAAQ